MPAIEFESVSKAYASSHGNAAPFHALQNVSFSIEEGEFFGLLGPNGAGKTTLISILAGLTRPSQGRVRVHGFDVQQDFMRARRHLGIVPQELAFDPFFTVREALRFQSGYFGLNRNDDWIDQLLHGLGLLDKASDNMRQLSGGMKRRVLVAQALVHRPPVIVLDEPTAGVDVELRQTLWQFISGLHRQGHTVLLTTHYLEEAEALCQRIALMKLGRLVALERTSALLAGSGAASVLHFKTDQPLPPELAAQARVTGRIVQLPAQDSSAVEQLLAALRQAQVMVEDLEIRRPDLEDVFLSLVGDVGTDGVQDASSARLTHLPAEPGTVSAAGRPAAS